MEVGTVEPPQVIKPRRGKASTFGGRRTGGGPNGGNDDQGPNDSGFDESNVPDKSRVIAWFVLLVVLMTFGGLISAYIVVSRNDAISWQPFDLPLAVWFSTALIIAAGITYSVAQRALFAEEQIKARNWLLATTALGGTFIASQLVVWLTLVSRGFYLQGNPYSGFFYIITVVHALHVVGGIIALGSIQIRSWNPTILEGELRHRKNLARAVGWYWHFMGFLWLVLLALLALWK